MGSGGASNIPPNTGKGGGTVGVGGSTTPGGGGSVSQGGSTGGGAPNGGTTGNGGSTGDGGSGAGPGAGGDNTGGHGACLDGITNYGADGPFMVTPKVMSPVNFWVPSVPMGCKVPIVHLANGTTATCSAYQPVLNRLATHGFLAICYESPNTGAGDQGITAFDAAMKAYPDLVDNKLGSTGHSQGGQAAFTVLALAEKKYGDKMIYAGLAMEPASGFGVQPTGTTWQALYAQIKSPMFMFSGLGTDGLVSQGWVQQAFDAGNKAQEAYFWTASGATHIPVPNALTQEVSIPWFRWKLLGDMKACQAFKALPMTHNVWAQVAVRNEKMCM